MKNETTKMKRNRRQGNYLNWTVMKFDQLQYVWARKPLTLNQVHSSLPHVADAWYDQDGGSGIWVSV
jgi:hypothetical protein